MSELGSLEKEIEDTVQCFKSLDLHHNCHKKNIVYRCPEGTSTVCAGTRTLVSAAACPSLMDSEYGIGINREHPRSWGAAQCRWKELRHSWEVYQEETYTTYLHTHSNATCSQKETTILIKRKYFADEHCILHITLYARVSDLRVWKEQSTWMSLYIHSQKSILLNILCTPLCTRCSGMWKIKPTRALRRGQCDVSGALGVRF